MERLINDRNLADRLGWRAQEVTDRFALSLALERWDTVFAEVLGRTSG
jgi:hypothetical protein